MNHSLKNSRGSFFRKHWLSLIIVVGALIGTTGFISWYNSSTNQRVATINSNEAKALKDFSAQLAAIKAKRAAEEAAKKKLAAQEALTSDQTSAQNIDSSLCNTSKTHNNPSSIDVVVNKQHCIQPVTYVPGDLVTSNGATLSAKVINAYNALFNAATAAGEPFYVTSSYRSYNDQVSTYNYWVSTSGKQGADTYSARPGYSEHQTGFAFDVAANGCVLNCFGNTSQYQWFQQHAAEYGFIQRYYNGYQSVTGYEAEEWHYRYVGVQVAEDMKAKGIKTLEQYWNISGGDY